MYKVKVISEPTKALKGIKPTETVQAINEKDWHIKEKEKE